MSPDFVVVAIIAAYNEADIIDHVVRDLIHQGISVYFLDDHSSDGTAAIVERHLGQGVIGIERLDDTRGDGAPRGFEWERLLRRKAQLARELDARWFMHQDADEFRESPWPGVSLGDAIQRVDALGYNAIDFASLNFWPVHDRFRAGDDVRDAFPFYEEGASHDRVQIRCWKNTGDDVDLASSGGHDARFPGRRVFPLRFILRHYPIRGQAHGERKVFRERRNRFLEAERARGWHVQYDSIAEGTSFIRDSVALTLYDPDAVRVALMLRHRDVEALEESVTESRLLIDAADRELARTREELARTREELVRVHQVLNSRTAEAAALCEAVERHAGALAATHGQLREQTREIDALRHAFARQVDEIERWRAAVADVTGRLDALERSLSWRWSAPARAVYRLFKGIQ